MFSELAEIQPNNTNPNDITLKQSSAEMDSTKNNDSKHFLMNPDKINEDIDINLNSLALLEKGKSNSNRNNNNNNNINKNIP